MIEIAISLAIIGIALVAIIGVLPLGMNVQRDNREQTIINQDASVFIEGIRGGARGLDDLTNYVYTITNYWTQFPQNAAPKSGQNSYDYGVATVAPGYFTTAGTFLWPSLLPLHSGTNIIGLLSVPEFTDLAGNPTNNLFSGGYSNHIVAYVHSLSGPASEKPPQGNDILRDNSFSYRLFCVNAPVVTDTNVFNADPANQVYAKQTDANLHDLRLTFLFPQRPNGDVGRGRITFRTLVAGQIVRDTNNNSLYFYQSQTFTNAL
ncbi:MAG TPA: hypothetical protein VFV23_11335 [Verrucomicrobiae bacterium]|nr:hypothetical protein [Verrucomicrobiae bacterium]